MRALQSDQNSDQVLKSKDDAFPNAISGHNFVRKVSSSVPEGKLMGVELIGVYKSGLINWG